MSLSIQPVPEGAVKRFNTFITNQEIQNVSSCLEHKNLHASNSNSQENNAKMRRGKPSPGEGIEHLKPAESVPVSFTMPHHQKLCHIARNRHFSHRLSP
jgi:hypothetical protein